MTDGELGLARTLLTEAAGLARDGGDGTGEFDCLHDLTRLGQAPAVVERLEELRAAKRSNTDRCGRSVRRRAVWARR